MINSIKDRLLAVLLIGLTSLILSVVIFNQNSLPNVKPCLQSPVCDSVSTDLGTLTVRQHGFPRVYRETSTFIPNDKTNYASAGIETKGVSYITIGINTLFWSSFLYIVYAAFSNKRNKKHKT
jgi:hypothetical protein